MGAIGWGAGKLWLLEFYFVVTWILRVRLIIVYGHLCALIYYAMFCRYRWLLHWCCQWACVILPVHFYFIFCGRFLGPVLVIAACYKHGGIRFYCFLVSCWVSILLFLQWCISQLHCWRVNYFKFNLDLNHKPREPFSMDKIVDTCVHKAKGIRCWKEDY
jgi:hypothetical protein